MISYDNWKPQEIEQGWAIRRKNNQIFKLEAINKKLKNSLNEIHSKGKKDNIEYMVVIKDDKIIGELNTLNDHNKVKMSENQIKEVNDNINNEYYIAHNHPINKPIEPFDLQVMDEYQNVRGVMVTTDNIDYIFIRSKGMKDIFNGINNYMYENIDKIKVKYPKLNNENLQYVALLNAFKSMGGKVIINKKN